MKGLGQALRSDWGCKACVLVCLLSGRRGGQREGCTPSSGPPIPRTSPSVLQLSVGEGV